MSIYKHINLWDITFCKLDDDGNYLTNEDGTVKLFHAPDKDFSHVVEYVELKDLEEVIEQLDETREKNDKQIDHEKKVFGGC
tara:strand:+ start:2036 stop:2281 length:246 start_codon:yes stop_codon:yes gene_type:complete